MIASRDINLLPAKCWNVFKTITSTVMKEVPKVTSEELGSKRTSYYDSVKLRKRNPQCGPDRIRLVMASPVGVIAHVIRIFGNFVRTRVSS